jgi:hypothetical protein
MNPSSEIKSLLNSYLKGAAEFGEFRSAFALFLRTALQYEEPARDLIWAIDGTIAGFSAGRISPEEATDRLSQLAQIEVVNPGTVKTGASNGVPQMVRGVNYSRLSVDIRPAWQLE